MCLIRNIKGKLYLKQNTLTTETAEHDIISNTTIKYLNTGYPLASADKIKESQKIIRPYVEIFYTINILKSNCLFKNNSYC